MKHHLLILGAGALAGALIFSGCSKKKEAPTQAGNGPADSTAASASDVTPELRIKWPMGRKYSMRMELAQSVTTKIPNQPEPAKQEVNMAQDFDMTAVKELENGGHELDLEFRNQTINVSQGGRQLMSFDSTQSAAQDGSNPIAPLLRKMVGGHIRYLTDANGKVDKVEGIDELMNRIGFNRKSQEQAMFKQMFSEDALRQYGSLGELLPNRAVKMGESWSLKRDFPSDIGTLDVNMKFTAKGWEQHGDHRCVRIDTQGTMSSKSGPGTTSSPVKIEDGKTSGSIWFDPELAMIVAADTQRDMDLKVLAGGQTMEPKLNQNIHMSMVGSGTGH